MKKIVIDARMINSSGIGTYLQNVITNLIKNYDLILLGRKDDLTKFPWNDKLEIIEFDSPIYSINEQLKISFKVPQCDIFLSPHYNVPLLPVKAKKRIVIIHDVNHLAFYNELSISQKIYAKLMMNFAVKLSDKIITISEFSRSEILKYLKADKSKISIVNFGFNFSEFSGQAADFENIRKKIGINSPYFLFVGNIKPHKNLFNLLIALKYFLKNNFDFKLIVVGEHKKLITADEKSFDFLSENYSIKDHIIFTGFIKKEELVSLYKNAAALVFPSFYEGFGIPPLEAMACGCPVVSSNAASLPEVCNDAVLYINPHDVNDITEKLSEIISDKILSEKLIKKGEENIKRFSEERFSEDLYKVMESVLL